MNHDPWIDPLQAVQEAAALVSNQLGGVLPEVCVIAGSGFQSLQRIGAIRVTIPVSDLAHMPVPSVHGHGSNLIILGTRRGPVLLFTGRVHLYEGRGVSSCLLYPALAYALGVRRFVFTHAVGGVHPLIRQGSIMLPNSGLDLTSVVVPGATALSPLSSVIDSKWVLDTAAGCLEVGVSTNGGTVAQVTGPSYETRAEIRMLRRIGAHAVGMSSVIEARWVASLGAKCLDVSFVSNVASDVSNGPLLHSHVVNATADATEMINAAVLSAIHNAP